MTFVFGASRLDSRHDAGFARIPFLRLTRTRKFRYPTVAVTTQITESRADRDSQQFQTTIERLAGKILGRELDLRLPLSERIRLLNLEVWAARYHLTVSQTLETLFSIFNVPKKHYRTRKDSLPVPVRLLCSDRARDMLEERVVSRQMDENEITKAGVRAAILHSMIPTTEKSVDSWVRQYRAGILEQRMAVDKARAELSRRKFRGNPFRILG